MNTRVSPKLEIDTKISDLENSLSMLKHQLMLQEVCSKQEEADNLEFYFKQVDTKCDNFHNYCSNIIEEVQSLFNESSLKETA